ncbi:MAG: heparan-alpha-glucosaminide N-acetyltransferase domain-containing protein [Lachnospiraceae bacterium]|jgi:hypothetical protein|nr:heparan-alpha-glucosaminide N-acetyltransferase domain-containing protein [Lachnospiraceae bacterium]
MKKLFADEHINNARQSEMDWARGLAVIFMIFVHVKSVMLDFQTPAIYAKIVEFCGGPLAAPVFMALLGAGIVYSRSSTPQKLATRGLILLGVHYLLNFFHSGLPDLVMYARTKDALYIEDFWIYTFGVDILAFAGLTFLFFALALKLKMKNLHILLVALVISVINYLTAIPVDNLALGAVLGLFFHVNDYAYFAFASWIWYPVMGYVFGTFMIRCKDKKVFYGYAFAFSALVLILETLSMRKYGFDIWSMHTGMKNDYFFQDFMSNIFVTAIFFVWMSILYFVSSKKIFDLPGKVVSRWSRNVTVIYIFQWLIIGWVFVLELVDLPVTALACTITGVIVVVLSDTLAWLCKKGMEKRGSRRGGFA